MKMTPTKRFAVRTTLATSTTLATIIGAQALVSLDENAFSVTPTAVDMSVGLAPQPTGSTDLSSSTDTTLKAAPPIIVILRHAGQQPVNAPSAAPSASITSSNPPSAAIQPPNPVQVVAPQPVQQQQPQQRPPAVAQTRSTR